MSAAGGSQLVITCLVCDEKIPTWRGDIRVECRCGAEYHARSGQLVDERSAGCPQSTLEATDSPLHILHR